MARTSIVKPLPVQQPEKMTTNAPRPSKAAKITPAKKNAMSALFGQKRQKTAIASVPTKTPAY